MFLRPAEYAVVLEVQVSTCHDLYYVILCIYLFSHVHVCTGEEEVAVHFGSAEHMTVRTYVVYTWSQMIQMPNTKLWPKNS